jgi:hypothetical protein
MSSTRRLLSKSVPGPQYGLRICWVSGKSMSVDLQEPVSQLKGMRPLKDKSVFAQAGKGEGGHSVVWPGEIDLGADRLWEVTLDLSRRQVAYYASGERPVPRYALLALKGWEIEHEGAAA